MAFTFGHSCQSHFPLSCSPSWRGGAGNQGNFCRAHAENDELMLSSYQPEISKLNAFCADLSAYSKYIIVLDFINSSLRKKYSTHKLLRSLTIRLRITPTNIMEKLLSPFPLTPTKLKRFNSRLPRKKAKGMLH